MSKKRDMKIFRYIDEKGKYSEYRFNDGRCIGFFHDGEEMYREKYKGKKLNNTWKEGLANAGFNLLTNN